MQKSVCLEIELHCLVLKYILLSAYNSSITFYILTDKRICFHFWAAQQNFPLRLRLFLSVYSTKNNRCSTKLKVQRWKFQTTFFLKYIIILLDVQRKYVPRLENGICQINLPLKKCDMNIVQLFLVNTSILN